MEIDFKEKIMIKLLPVKCLLLLAAATLFSADGFAQVTVYNPNNSSNYQNVAPGVRFNPLKGSVHQPGVAVHKASGTYNHLANGYYQNPVTGNIYNPTQGTYSTGKDITFRPGEYQNLGGGVRYNSQTQAVHIPGQKVIKPSGTYYHQGGGHYVNPNSGNTYNPYTRSYKYGR